MMESSPTLPAAIGGLHLPSVDSALDEAVLGEAVLLRRRRNSDPVIGSPPMTPTAATHDLAFGGLESDRQAMHRQLQALEAHG